MHSVNAASAHDVPSVAKGMLVLEEASSHQGMTPASFANWESSLFIRRNLVYDHEETCHVGAHAAAEYSENDDFAID